MVDYRESVVRPFSNLKKLSVGALLTFIPSVELLVGWFLFGYAFKCAREPQDDLPSWWDVKTHFNNGFRAWLLHLFYLIPYLALSYLVFSTSQVQISSVTSDGVSTVLQLSTAKLSLLAILTMIFIYTVTLGLLRSIKTLQFFEGVNLDAIFSMALEKEYAEAAVFMLGLAALIVFMNVAFRGLLTERWKLLSIVVYGYSYVYILITGFTLLGQVYDETDSF